MSPNNHSDRANCVRRKGDGHPSAIIPEVARLLNTEEAFRASIRSSSVDQFVIPLHKPGNRRQWAYLDSASRLRRRVWAIDIEHNREHYCFFDYEMRRKGEKAAALVKLLSGAIISDADFNTILHGVSTSEGNWKSSFFSQHGLIAIKCLHTWSTTEQCAKTITQLFRRLV